MGIRYVNSKNSKSKEDSMKTLVAYYSETDNTRRLADAIYEKIIAAEKDIIPIGEVDPDPYDIIFVGFPVKANSVPGKVEKFIKSIPEGRKLAFFLTHGSMRGGQLAVTALYHAMGLAARQTILGSFGCRGQVRADVIESLLQKPEHKAWAMEAQSADGHPDDADLEDCREFADAMIAKARNI